MCGIFGQFKPEGANRALVEAMGAGLRHRGPDGSAVWAAGPLAFGATRLAIIDLSAPAGPIFNEDGRIGVAFNGEIYNYRELRRELESLGHAFATRTDTEVIVHGYETWGADVLHRLRGMFAIALWDGGAERLLLVRDRLGEKPLYFARLGGGEVVFASEVKALLAHPGLVRRVNPDALPLFLTLGYVPPPRTMFAGIEKLAPGEMVTIDAHGLDRRRYWQPVMDTTGPAPDYPEAVRQVRAALTAAVESRLVSDVPVGMFLSGGVDSSAVTALARRALPTRLKTFTVGFDLPEGSRPDQKFNVDVRYAAEVARHLDTDHHAIILHQTEALAGMFARFVYQMDEPVTQQGITQTAFVAALARASGVPVLLTGDAADELFEGYDHYRADVLVERYQRLPALLRRAVLDPLLARAPARLDGLRKLARKSQVGDPVLRYLEWLRMVAPERLPGLLADEELAAGAGAALDGVLGPLLAAPRTDHFADRIAFASLNLWIAEDSNMRVDKMSMLNSVESRAPFLDHDLVALALRLPLAYKLRGGDFKRVLKDAVRDLLPPEVFRRPKWGFSPPSSEWLRTVFRPLVDTYLSPEHVAAVGLFQPEAVARLVDDHLTKRQYELWPVMSLLVFHLWHAMYIEQSLIPAPLTPADLVGQSTILHEERG